MDGRIAVGWRVPRLSPVAVDGLTALGAAGLSLAQMQGYPSTRDRSIINVVFVLSQTIPLVFRRRAPFTIFAVAGASLAAQFIFGFQGPLFAFLAVSLALYTLAAYGERRLATLGLRVSAFMITFSLVQLVVTTWPDLAVVDLYDVFDDYVLLAAAWILGVSVRRRRIHAEELGDRAARLEREREEKARQAVTQERLRIARELHDVVAHGLSVIGVQAGAARLVLDSGSDPTRAREAVAAIEDTANRAMVEMRRALGILRDREEPEAALAPPDGLHQLPVLLERVRAAGLPVGLTVRGTPQTLATSIDLSAYRIVQEALTNALKHARATRAEIVIRYGEHDIEVEVADDGRGRPPSSEREDEGAGTVGMRERVALFGGDLWAGPRPEGGYSVQARLPTSGGQP